MAEPSNTATLQPAQNEEVKVLADDVFPNGPRYWTMKRNPIG